MPSRPRDRSSVTPRFPLSLRLPNGPPVFVGRAREIEALEAAIRRGPVASVWGVGGLGKSTLAFHVLHTRFQAQARRTLMVKLTRAEAIDQALLTVAQTLAEIHGATGINWQSLLADRDALVATLIDLADGTARERGRDPQAHWILIDDLHHADPDRATELVAQLARYARRSRWILISRTKIVPDGALSQTVALGAMTAAELQALGERWGLAEPVGDHLVSAAAGSPWRLGQLLSGAQPGFEPGRGDILEGLPAEIAAFLLDLAFIEVELPEETLARFTTLPPREALAGLERRGLIERRPRGLRLHDVARGLAGASLDATSARAKRRGAARVLCESADPATWLEGLRLFVGEGEAALAAAALDSRSAAELEVGQVLGVWRELARSTAPELASWRLRCATEIGDPAALRVVPLPPSPTAADRVRWALSLFQQGRYEEVGAAGAEARVAALAAGEDGLAFEAGRLLGRAASNMGHLERALEVFTAQRPATSRQVAQRDVDIAVCLAGLGRRDLALAQARAVEDRLLEHPEVADRELYLTVGMVFYNVGALRLAERAVERFLTYSGELRGHDAASTRALIMSCTIAIDRGAFIEAERLLDKLSPFALRSPAYSIYAAMLRMELRLMTGGFEGLRADFMKFVEVAAKTGREDFDRIAFGIRVRMAMALCEPPEGPPLDLKPNDTLSKDLALIWDAIHRARWGESTSAPAEMRSSVPGVHALGHLSQAWVALGTGKIEAGLKLAEEAAILADTAGYGGIEALAHEARADAEILAGSPAPNVTAIAAALMAIAKKQGMTPLMIHSELALLLASAEGFDPGRLEGIAAHPSAPVAARRARALLGEDCPLDFIDRAVVSAARKRLGCRIQPVTAGVSAGGFTGGWGLDDRTRTVWLPDRSCSLAERPLLWRMLSVIAGGGGAVEKEALVTGAWELRGYHPHRDDARLHTAIGALRKLIEDDPTSPKRLVTTEVGYAFGRAAPVRRLIDERAPGERDRG
jgi:hypothetical protein